MSASRSAHRLPGFAGWLLAAGVTTLGVGTPVPASGEVTFSKDIAPILQRSCQRCHRADGFAPMSLVTYEEVRPYARAVKHRTGLRDKPGVMPPWMIEKNIGIQRYKGDSSLGEQEILTIAAWVDGGAPEGDPADLPPPLSWPDRLAWEIGEPDLIVDSPSFTMPALAADWWGSFDPIPMGLTEDRYIAAYEVKELHDAKNKEIAVEGAAQQTAGLSIFHHALFKTLNPDGDNFATCCNTHEAGRNAEWFDPEAGKQVKAGATLFFNTVHIHANGRETTARMRVGFKFHPRGYTPAVHSQLLHIATNPDLIDIPGMAKDVRFDGMVTLQDNVKVTVFEPHMHLPGVRMCLEATYGQTVETLSCAGYNHSWVLAYTFEDDYAPLLPKGTILRIIGYFDNSPSNPVVPDPRNWSGGGNRSVDNMNINIGQVIPLTDEQFEAEMEKRRRTFLSDGERRAILGCPLCVPFGRETPQAARSQ
ncbi:MAG: hypothetical protein FJW23_17560 [Acidimicrobiia bacterium]|nr:hypothetical protein [Acidimicrobiia bacterium]